jgi:hypothetical protein
MNRRSFLGKSAAALAATAATIPAAADTIEADPVFAAIEHHRATAAAVEAMRSTDPDWENALDVDADAWLALVETEPTTIAGLAAFTAHVAAYPDLHSICSSEGPAQALETIAAAASRLNGRVS